MKTFAQRDYEKQELRKWVRGFAIEHADVHDASNRVVTRAGEKVYYVEGRKSPFKSADQVAEYLYAIAEKREKPKTRKKNPQPLDPGIMADNRVSSFDRAVLHAIAYSKNQTLPVFIMDYGGAVPFYITTDPELKSGIPAVVRVYLDGKRADYDEATIEAPKRRGRNPSPRKVARKKIPIATGRFRVFFTNMDYFSQEEFDDADKALKYAKSKGFGATIYDPEGKPFLEWSIIGGTRALNPKARETKEPAAGALIYWAQTTSAPFIMSPHFGTKKPAQDHAKILGHGTGQAVAVMRGTHAEYLHNAGAK